MLTNVEIKRLKSFQEKKARRETGLFLAETPKVCELLLRVGRPVVREIYALDSWLNRKEVWNTVRKCERRQNSTIEIREINAKELERVSGLVSPQEVLTVLEIPSCFRADLNPRTRLYRGCSLVLDDIRDPGNLGTILRIADWFGIDHIICTSECADAYQPKCVQSSMGSVGVCDIHYAERAVIVRAIKENTKVRVFGTFLKGSNLFETELPHENAWYVIGNEARGIAEDLAAVIKNSITIPPYAKKGGFTAAESLNAAVATAILCAEIRRK